MEIYFPKEPIHIERTKEGIRLYLPITFDLDKTERRILSDCTAANLKTDDEEQRTFECRRHVNIFAKNEQGDFVKLEQPFELTQSVSKLLWFETVVKNENISTAHRFELQLTFTIDSDRIIDHDIIFTVSKPSAEDKSRAEISKTMRPGNVFAWVNFGSFLIILLGVMYWNSSSNIGVYNQGFLDYSNIKFFLGLLTAFVGLPSFRWLVGLIPNIKSFSNTIRYPELYLDTSFLRALRSKRTSIFLISFMLVACIFVYALWSVMLPGLDGDFAYFDISNEKDPIMISAPRVYKDDLSDVKIAYKERAFSDESEMLYLGELNVKSWLPTGEDIENTFYEFTILGELAPDSIIFYFDDLEKFVQNPYVQHFRAFAHGKPERKGFYIDLIDEDKRVYKITHERDFDKEILSNLMLRFFEYWLQVGDTDTTLYNKALTLSDDSLQVFNDGFNRIEGILTKDILIEFYQKYNPDAQEEPGKYLDRTILPRIIVLGYLFDNLGKDTIQFSENNFSQIFTDYENYYSGVDKPDLVDKKITRVYLRFILRIEARSTNLSQQIHNSIDKVLSGKELYLIYLEECLRFNLLTDARKSYFEHKLVRNKIFTRQRNTVLSIKDNLETFRRRYGQHSDYLNKHIRELTNRLKQLRAKP